MKLQHSRNIQPFNVNNIMNQFKEISLLERLLNFQKNVFY